ncbi:MAG: acyltransferase [Oscillospiraceae bacterium]|nr:acyltransferase [Oscillospiraceae bacterium]
MNKTLVNQRFSTELLRVLGMSIVFLSHFLDTVRMPRGAWFTIFHAAGPQLFFALSGYCLSLRYRELPSWKDYYRSRFLALMPLYYLTFLLFYPIQAFLYGNPFYGGPFWKLVFTLTASDMYVTFFYIPTYAVIGEWFSFIILLLYAAFPLLRRLMQRHSLLTSAVILAGFLANWKFRFIPITPEASPFTGLLSFWGGMMAQKYMPLMEKRRGVSAPLCAAVCVGIFLAPCPKFFCALALAVFGMTFLLLILPKESPLGTPVLRFLAGNSYSFYLCHHFLILRAAALGGPLCASRPGMLALCAITAAISLLCAWCINQLYAFLIRRVRSNHA